MAENDFEKTESPTQRRRDEARQDGNIARSQDLTAACIAVAAMVLLYFFGLNLYTQLRGMSQAFLTSAHASNPTRADDLGAMASFAGREMIWTLGPLILGISCFALLSSIGQVGFLLTLKPLQPSLNKLSILKGLKRLADARAGVRLLMSLLKIGLVGAVATVVIAADLGKVLKLMELGVTPAFGAAAEIVFWLSIKLGLVLLLLAAMDYGFQRWKHEQDLKMTKQEIKEEMKRMDGDPMVKQRRARVARQLAMQRIAAAVPKADVVVTNPTHFSVALRYDAESMRAPKVVAKGADYMALRIRQIALSHGVPLVERKPLAQALYRNVEIGQEVPPDHYAAVAEILAYVYRLSEKKSA